jgi:pyruvate/2-oxoglutarate dehydrogenase complex dihydrolipoamide dehydrogenase (E3) component
VPVVASSGIVVQPGAMPELDLAVIGAGAASHRVTLLRAPLAENDRSVAEADVTGLVKLVVAGNRVLGAGILAPHAGEMNVR